MFRKLLLATALLTFAAPAFAEDHDHDHDHHVSELDGLRAVHAWTRATSGKTALVFVEIENGSGKDVLLQGGESAHAASVDLVGFKLQDGAPAYVLLPSLPVKAGREVELSPEGLALRLNGLKEPLKEGEEIEMEIEFDAGHLEVHVEVEDADATQHGHAGHSH